VRSGLARALRLLGLAALGAVAAAGVLLSAAAAFTASPFGRPMVAGLVVRQLDGLLAGTLALGGIELQLTGVELRDLEVRDPAGRQVLRVRRGLVSLDLRRLHRREIGLSAELDGPAVLLEELPDGGVGLARAFSPARPAAPRLEGASASPGRLAWTIHLPRLTVREGEVLWLGAGGETRLEAAALEAGGAGSYGPRGGDAQLAVRAAVSAPSRGPLSLEVAASLDGDRLSVPLARASLGATALEALGELDLRGHAGRVALVRLGLARDQAEALAPRAAPGGDLAATGYAEADGERATAFLEVRPDGGGTAAGQARLAAAARGLPPAALGFDVAVQELDPSRLVAAAPAGRISLSARGAAAGTGLADARGRLDLRVAASRLGAGSFGPLELRAAASGGRVEVGRLEARLPGLAVSGAGEWRDRGPVSGRITLDAADLARFTGNLAALGGPALPAVQGRVRAEASLSGTGAAPMLRGAVEAPRLALGESRVEDLGLEAEVAGPLASARLRVDGRAGRLAVAGLELRAVSIDGTLAGDEASLELLGTLPTGEGDALSIRSAGRLSKDRRTATVRELALAWPGARYQLAGPAELALEGPSVDWLELADGERRLSAGGGFGARGALDARLSVIALDLARLPRGLLPPDVAGELTLEATARGTAARPEVEAHLVLAGGAVAGLDGLSLHGTARWDPRTRRLAAEAALGRGAGGTVEAAADLPLPLGRARGAEPLSLRVAAAGWPIEALRRAAGIEAPLSGTAGAWAELSGTVAAPTLAASAAVEDGRAGDLGPFSAEATLEAPAATARASLAVGHAGARLLSATAEAPLDVAGLLVRPVEAVRALASAPLHAAVDVPGADLGAFAGRGGLPDGLAGTLVASAALAGTATAPRGTAELSVTDVALAGYRGLAAAATAVLGPDRTELTGRVAVGGDEALHLQASLGAPVEALASRAALGRAPLQLEARVPPLALAQAAGPALPLAGTVAARLAAGGSLAAPEISLEADGQGLALDGRALGDLQASAGYSAGSARAEVAVRAAAGGTLQAAATLEGRLGLDADAAALARAPLRARLTANQLDLGALPAVLPGVIRSASGPLDAELTAAGPLEAPVPRGTVRLRDARVAISEYGAWTEIDLEVSADGRALRVERFAARRGKGRIRGELSAQDLGTEAAPFSGRLVMEKLTVMRAGMDVVTLDLTAELAGTLRPSLVDATLTIPGGTVRLPKKAPRALQDLEERPDVVVERPGELPRAAARAGPPFEVRLRLVAPGKLFVKGDSPRIDVELKADSTWRWAGGELLAEGPVELVRGTFEPIGGRIFVVDRGRVQFTGAAYGKGQLEAVARWESLQADVTVTVGGTVEKPSIALTSDPPLDEASIVALIATGRTELRAGTSEIGSLSSGSEVGAVDSTGGGASSLDTKELGMAAAGAVTTMLFNDLLSDKVPVDSIAVDSTQVRAGKYLPGGKFFVQYIRRFEADPEKNENSDEVRVEYQITPSWTFESRYGNAMTGGASLIWSRDY
jgi:translocation and assembly module TamB